MYLDERYLQFSPPAQGALLSAKEAMRLAIDYAFQGIGRVSPNPLVGCVIVDEQHKFLAGGFHRAYGDMHAEIEAWQALPLGCEYKNLTMYVTLEPCAHEGKQPSCAKKLATLPIKKVLMGCVDPNPLVAGKGQAILQNAGIECAFWDSAKSKNEVKELLHTYLWSWNDSTPFVALKVATDSQGVFALESSKKLWITNPRSRKYSHFLRAYYDAIIIGRDTVVQDNPLLDSRLFCQDVPPRPIVVLDPQAELLRSFPGSALNILQKQDRKIFWAIQDDLDRQARLKQVSEKSLVEFIALPYSTNKGLDMATLLKILWSKNLRSIFIEGGAHAYAGFLDGNLVNRIYHFQTHAPLEGDNKRLWYEKCQKPPALGEPSGLLTLDDNTLNIYELKRSL